MLYAYLFKYIIIGDTGVRARAAAVALAQSEWPTARAPLAVS